MIELTILKRPLGLYKANCYILIKDNQSIIIDPGFHSQHIIEMVKDTTPLAVLLTHGHCDHVTALDDVCQYFNIPAYLHPNDQELLQLIRRRPSVYKKKMYTECEDLIEGQLQVGPFDLQVHHTPGHSTGSVCIQWENHLFTGDTVFKQMVGTIDTYTGNAAEMKASIERIITFSDAVYIHPGHQEDTTIKDERPYLLEYIASHQM